MKSVLSSLCTIIARNNNNMYQTLVHRQRRVPLLPPPPRTIASPLMSPRPPTSALTALPKLRKRKRRKLKRLLRVSWPSYYVLPVSPLLPLLALNNHPQVLICVLDEISLPLVSLISDFARASRFGRSQALSREALTDVECLAVTFVFFFTRYFFFSIIRLQDCSSAVPLSGILLN